MENIVFLTYISRSGSTFLAKLLNECEDIGVSIEARMPDGILYRSLEINQPKDVKRALEVLWSDGKFRAWNLDKKELENELHHLEYPIGYDKLLQTVLRMYFKIDDVRIFIYKNGYYIEHIEDIRTIFPDARFVFLLRDLRAIYNSQKASLNSETLKPMARNPVMVAKYYEKILSIIDEYSQFNWLHVMKYEDLILNTNREMDRLLGFLGSRGIRHLAQDYYEKLPEREKQLHTNVNSGPLKERMNAWQHELSQLEIVSIQNVADDALRRHHYEIVYFDTVPIKVWIGYLVFRLKYLISVIYSIMRSMIRRFRIKKGKSSSFYRENLIGWSSRP